MKMSKLCFIDLETTGTSHIRNSIIQIGGIVEIDSKVVKRFEIKIAPYKSENLDPEILKKSGFTSEQVLSHPSVERAYVEFTALMSAYIDKFNKNDKFYFIGYNCHQFDQPFLREFFVTNKDMYFGSWFYFPSIDVMLIAAMVEHLNLMPRPKSFSLMDVATTLGIAVSEESLHRADYDIELTRLVYRKLCQLIKRPGSVQNVETKGDVK